MKKTLALILAVLVAFSMFSFATIAADGDLVNIKFMNNGKVYHSIDVRPGEALTPYVPADPTREPDVDANGKVVTEYIFKGWAISEDSDVLYFKNTLPAAGEEDVTYMAIYSAKEVRESQTFWEFIESIFARINLIFEYFARIFDFTR